MKRKSRKHRIVERLSDWFDGLEEQGKVKRLAGIVGAVVGIFAFILINWRWNLPLNICGIDSYIIYGAFVVVVPLSLFLLGVRHDACYARPQHERDEAKTEKLERRNRRRRRILYVLMPFFVWVAIGAIGILAVRFPVSSAKRYAAQLQVPEAVEFKADSIAPFDATQIPWVSEENAKALGDKLIGTLGAVGSSIEVGEYVRQEVNGELFFVAPILHNGFWRYNANPSGTPGYIMVSMTDSNDVRLISDYKIRVQPEKHAAWGDKLERIVSRLLPFGLRYEIKFEIDDELHPWWVVPIYEKKIGLWGGSEITKVVIVDATDGRNAQVYELSDVPAWVDRIYPSSLIEAQLGNWGAYSGGFWNTFFGKTGMLQSDEGNSVIYLDDGCYLFDTLTSYGGADESIVGFVLTNLRTKEVKRYSLAGATEFAACQSALGDERVKAQNYEASYPLLTSVAGRPTYFIPLNDPNSSITKSFALVDIAKHHVVGIGSNVAEVERDYLIKLNENHLIESDVAVSDLLEITGKVVRWGAYEQDGSTRYIFVVSGHEDKLFSTDASVPEATITREGDQVKFEVMATDDAIWTAYDFDNLDLPSRP